MADERTQTDPEQWRALMALSDSALLRAWKEAREARDLAYSQRDGLEEATRWMTLIEGAAASRFGVGTHFDRYRAEYS